MTEQERIREKALLADEEILSTEGQYPINKDLTGEELFKLALKLVAQAQLDKALKADGIEIRAENQDLPTTTLPRGYELTNPIFRRVIQEDMLKPDKEGKHWVRVIPKGR